MTQIFSKVDNKIICSYIRKKEISAYRQELGSEQEFMQVSARLLDLNTNVAPHKHKPVNRVITNTQEAWVVLQGEIEATIYDIDNRLLDTIRMQSGDCIVLFRGGHGLQVLQDNTLFYEFKNGPYFGVEMDKEKI
jgi:cupin fold WbuC family metalloprotein